MVVFYIFLTQHIEFKTKTSNEIILLTNVVSAAKTIIKLITLCHNLHCYQATIKNVFMSCTEALNGMVFFLTEQGNLFTVSPTFTVTAITGHTL